jgi:hypothetical protein
MFFGSFNGKMCSGKYLFYDKHKTKKLEERDTDVRKHGLGSLQAEYLGGYRDHSAPFRLGVVLLGYVTQGDQISFSPVHCGAIFLHLHKIFCFPSQLHNEGMKLLQHPFH